MCSVYLLFLLNARRGKVFPGWLEFDQRSFNPAAAREPNFMFANRLCDQMKKEGLDVKGLYMYTLRKMYMEYIYVLPRLQKSNSLCHCDAQEGWWGGVNAKSQLAQSIWAQITNSMSTGTFPFQN